MTKFSTTQDNVAAQYNARGEKLHEKPNKY